jgi:hypothetical protein
LAVPLSYSVGGKHPASQSEIHKSTSTTSLFLGAGGHALEVYDILKALDKIERSLKYLIRIWKKLFKDSYRVSHHPENLKEVRTFVWGGSRNSRKYLYGTPYKFGKKAFRITAGSQSVISPSAMLDQVDVLHNCFIG